MHPLRELLLDALRTDIRQMAEEGHDTAALSRELKEAEEQNSLDALARFQVDLWNRPSPDGFPYEEPSDWASIASGFPDPESHVRFVGSEGDLNDRLLAGWQGRCAGCQAGKPVEGCRPEKIREFLGRAGSWPLTDYVKPMDEGTHSEVFPDQKDGSHFRYVSRLCRGKFDAVLPDDDLHYSIVGLMTIEKHGPGFTGEQAIEQLIQVTPASIVYASGRNMLRTALFGMKSPYTARFGNPCRQSLGAQIRCDPWGWCSPGDPALAADMAFRDAANSQTRNGIYSGIFFSVLIADVLAHGDPVRAVDTAVQYVPRRSRFAEMLEFVRSVCAGEEDWETVNRAVLEKYAGGRREEGIPGFNHSLPNGAIAVMSLLKSRGDFTRAVGMSVMAGLDTDCNAATVGSIMGCALGTEGIPAHWTEPLNDRIRTELRGMPELRISELAERTCNVAIHGRRST